MIYCPRNGVAELPWKKIILSEFVMDFLNSTSIHYYIFLLLSQGECHDGDTLRERSKIQSRLLNMNKTSMREDAEITETLTSLNTKFVNRTKYDLPVKKGRYLLYFLWI